MLTRRRRPPRLGRRLVLHQARDAAAQPLAAPTNVPSNFSQLVGAVGAAVGATSSAPAIIVVDGTSTSTLDPQPAPQAGSATVLSF